MIYLADNTEAFKASFTADKIINVMVETDGLSLEEIKDIRKKIRNKQFKSLARLKEYIRRVG